MDTLNLHRKYHPLVRLHQSFRGYGKLPVFLLSLSLTVCSRLSGFLLTTTKASSMYWPNLSITQEEALWAMQCCPHRRPGDLRSQPAIADEPSSHQESPAIPKRRLGLLCFPRWRTIFDSCQRACTVGMDPTAFLSPAWNFQGIVQSESSELPRRP